MIDLNAEELKPISIFNDGKAGIAKNVTIKVQPKQASDPDNRPDFNLIITDQNGGILREGFYHFKPNDTKSTQDNEATLNRTIRRFGTIVSACFQNGTKPTFPNWTDAKTAYNDLFKMINDNAQGKLFNVFVTYGTTNYVNKNGYLKLRYFDFIEPAGEVSRLRAKPSDLMERVTPDSEPGMTSNSLTQDTPNSPTMESWTS